MPAAQRSPSPNTAPKPEPCFAVPWKKRHVEFAGIAVPFSVTVSLDTSALPVAVSRPAEPVEFRQPDSSDVALLLPHGHGVAEIPSPMQNGAPVSTSARMMKEPSAPL